MGNVYCFACHIPAVSTACAVYEQPCLEKKNLGRKQTLTYIKGYSNEAPVMTVDEPLSPNSTQLIATQTYGSPKATQNLGTTLPQWVENDRKVTVPRYMQSLCLAPQNPMHGKICMMICLV